MQTTFLLVRNFLLLFWFILNVYTCFFIRNLCGEVKVEVPHFLKELEPHSFLSCFFNKKKVFECFLDLLLNFELLLLLNANYLWFSFWTWAGSTFFPVRMPLIVASSTLKFHLFLNEYKLLVVLFSNMKLFRVKYTQHSKVVWLHLINCTGWS